MPGRLRAKPSGGISSVVPQVPQCYPGDDVVDIISRDMYPEPHTHTSQSAMYTTRECKS